MNGLSQHLEAIGHQWDALDYIADRLANHARDLPHANATRTLSQLELAALTTCAKAVLADMSGTMTAIDGIVGERAVSEAGSHETAVALTDSEYRRLLAAAKEWKVDPDTAASRMVMEELRRRLSGLSEASPRAD